MPGPDRGTTTLVMGVTSSPTTGSELTASVTGAAASTMGFTAPVTGARTGARG
jgi:hypothetical protein